MREHNRGPHLADNGGNRAQQGERIPHLEVIALALVILGAEHCGRLLRLAPPDPAQRRRAVDEAAGGAVGDVQIMRPIARFAQQAQCSRHREFDVVGMGRDRDGGTLSH